ncbi:ribosomal protein S18-alanine N-acetyltransferase [Bifidobacterium scaligerum]|uniref:Ribosomal-protein-alanine N-acetyltransferase n=1 Tax=Bifidobacterium scaligerum TaxID=2052656 RepID=A0A2M9HTE0_9BIFI|nr:ribosomal protein S18-alanine N-acetyltransferase [Bifidobacterium scaligerum]PJM80081.1 ribosomal-protein-alanine N-acetyltransferase [Bifidobacterium scaligerum]
MIVDVNKFDREEAVAAMRALEVELFGNHAWSETSVREELTGPDRTYVFDVIGDGVDDAIDAGIGSIRGFAGYWYDGEDAEIMDVGVGRVHQRQGIARALMETLIERAKIQGARRMLLEVSVINEPAIALYRGLGFERIGVRKRYYQPEGIDAYVMALDLEPRIIGFQRADIGADDVADKTGPDNDSADEHKTEHTAEHTEQNGKES